MSDPFRIPRGPRFFSALGLTGAILLATACSSAPLAPTSSLDAARTAIRNAERAGAGRYSAIELNEARQKLAAADSAVNDENMGVAGQLAEQSRLDAELASARTAAAKAMAVNKEMSLGADALSEEMQRAGDQR